jgi:hypothetical protein
MLLTYDRLFNDTYGWLIDNPTRLDEDGSVISINKYIRNIFQLYSFRYSCKLNTITFNFDNDLTTEEQQLLHDKVVEYQVIQ